MWFLQVNAAVDLYLRNFTVIFMNLERGKYGDMLFKMGKKENRILITHESFFIYEIPKLFFIYILSRPGIYLFVIYLFKSQRSNPEFTYTFYQWTKHINVRDFISDLYKYYLETSLKFRILYSQKRMIRSINLSWLYSCEQYIPKTVPQPTPH